MVFARSLSAEFGQRGLDWQAVLSDSEIRHERLLDVLGMLTFQESERLVRTAVLHSADAGIGLAAGQHTPPHALHLVSVMMLAQRTLRDAIATFSQFSGLLSDGPVYRLSEDADTATWSCTPAVPPSDASRVMVDYALSLAASLGRVVCHGTSYLAQGLSCVRFKHAEPSYSARYRDVFGCTALFDQELNGIVFPRAALDAPHLHADRTVSELARAPAKQLLREASDKSNWAARVRFLLTHQIDFREVTAESIAARMSVSPRGLRRHLDAEGTSFSSLLDEARCEFACARLRSNDAPLRELAAKLGFADLSAFGRAFRRWTGSGPQEYRRRATHCVGAA